MTEEPRIFARFAEALRPGAPPLRPTDLRAMLADLLPVKFEAEGVIDSAGLVLERIETFEQEITQRLQAALEEVQS